MPRLGEEDRTLFSPLNFAVCRPLSMLANVALMFGFVAVLVHVANGFEVHPDVELARWSLSPVFFGVVVG